MITRNVYCQSDDPCSATDDGVCTRLHDHDGDHYDRRWHNTGQTYGRDPVEVGGD